ncbi:TonB-dependent siderophore receptor [Pseudomonas sp. S04]|uniref:TonB-dependent siderophore receptor n=1 Tax=unclassified Pseudomonas TaxID=196821 RepID=UPI00131F5CF3|nr:MULTISPECIES: TonB-dependent siderophore receptor [unclassified Pseudomonas]QHD01885.1 TonB-dependent siderophore receptor [Pseudomonas sp. S04]QHF34368.1 TonB-dependent siderophore receptor [Pseudomonas sp. S19]
MSVVRPQGSTPPFRRTACHALFSLLLSGTCAQAWAAEPQPLANTQARSYQIPAGTLGQTLSRFAAASHIALSFDPSLTDGLQSPGLNGNYSPLEALSHLLHGSGLDLQQRADASFTLVRSANGDALQLAPTAITGQGLGVTTEDTHSYTTSEVSIGKGNIKLKDIPQSVSVVTRQRMDDQNMNSLQDAMRQVTGATIKTYNSGSSLNDVYMRGFLVDQVQVDGVSQPTGQGDMATSFDLAMYDRVEVLRGPSGLYQGAGEPGGTINVVRKRALGRFALGGELGAGSYDHYRSSVDVTGPLNEQGSVRGRFITAYENNQSFVDYAQNERPMVYGRLEFDLDPSTTLSVGGAYQQNHSTPAFGLPAYADGRLLDVPRSTFVDAKWNELNEKVWESFAEVDHALDNGGQFKTTLTYRDAETPKRNFTWADGAVDPATGDSWAVAYNYYTHIKTIGVDSFVTTPFEAFERSHEFTVGGEYQHLDKDFTYGGGDYFPINVFDPGSIDIPKQDYERNNGNWSKSDQYGFYTRAKLNVSDWLDVVGGSRVSWYESDAQNANAFFNNFSSAHTSINRKVVPYGALIAKLTPELSAYASYTGVFKPQSEIGSDSSPIGPRKGKQYEVGLKREFYDGRLNASVAVFRIYDENRAEYDNLTAAYEAQGKARSQGWETELSGNLSDNWSLVTGYAFTTTKTLEADDGNEGKTFSTITPKHNFNLWTKYQFTDGPLKDFSVGGGVRIVSKTYFQREVRFEQSGYGITTAQVGYKINDNLSTTLTANNLFDRKYYDRVDASWGTNFYGDPRNLTLTLRAQY